MLRLIGRVLAAAVVLGALLLVFDLLVVGNPQALQLTLPGLAVQASLGLLVAGAIAVGMVLAVLLLLPGRWRAGRRGQRLRRYAQRLEGELSAARERLDPRRATDHADAPPAEHHAPPAGLPRTGPIIPAPAAPVTSPREDRPRPGAEIPPSASAQPISLVTTTGSLPSMRAQQERTAVLPGSLVVGRIAGIQIAIHISWLIIVALLTASLATTIFPQTARGHTPGVYWLFGLGATLLLFASVLLHELGHALVARARGLPVSSITLFLFGGVSNLEQEPRSPGEEFAVAVIGPVISLVVGGMILALAPLASQSDLLWHSLLVYLGATNVALGIFNLLPGFPLDGGRVLRATLWKITGNLQTATRWAARVGQGVAFVLILVGVWQFFLGNLLTGIWTGFVGWFMLTAAQSANMQVALDATLRGVMVAQAMSAPPPAVERDRPVQAVVDGLFWPHGLSSVLVAEAGKLVGMVTPAEIRRLPRELWAETTVARVMIPSDRLLTIAPRQPLSAALALLAAQHLEQLLVVQQGAVVGLLTRDAVMRLVDARRGLEPPQAQPSAGALEAAEAKRPGQRVSV
jgi:Zn-dependent protease/predicted transcriptional regulator